MYPLNLNINFTIQINHSFFHTWIYFCAIFIDILIRIEANENKFATIEELNAIDEKISSIVEASVKFAEESPWPDDSELLKDVYIDSSYPFIVD
jgi:hypothetical protein